MEEKKQQHCLFLSVALGNLRLAEFFTFSLRFSLLPTVEQNFVEIEKKNLLFFLGGLQNAALKSLYLFHILVVRKCQSKDCR